MNVWTMRVTERCSRHTSAWVVQTKLDKLSQDMMHERDTGQQGDVQRATACTRLRVRGCRRPLHGL